MLAILHIGIAEIEFTAMKKEAFTEHTWKKISLLFSKFSYIKVKQKQKYHPLRY